MAHGQGAVSGRTPRSVGAYGSKRGKEAQRRKRDARDQQGRNAEAAEATRKAREELDLLIKHQQENPVLGETEGARYARERAEREETVAQAELDQAQVMYEDSEDQTDLPKRPCHKVARREEHDEHEWERGGLKIKSFCEGFVVKVPEYAEPISVKEYVAPEIPDTGEGFWQFAYTTARMMLRQGYNIKYVCEFTGVGKSDLDDIAIDSHGFGIVQKKEEGE